MSLSLENPTSRVLETANYRVVHSATRDLYKKYNDSDFVDLFTVWQDYLNSQYPASLVPSLLETKFGSDACAFQAYKVTHDTLPKWESTKNFFKWLGGSPRLAQSEFAQVESAVHRVSTTLSEPQKRQVCRAYAVFLEFGGKPTRLVERMLSGVEGGRAQDERALSVPRPLSHRQIEPRLELNPLLTEAVRKYNLTISTIICEDRPDLPPVTLIQFPRGFKPEHLQQMLLGTRELQLHGDAAIVPVVKREPLRLTSSAQMDLPGQRRSLEPQLPTFSQSLPLSLFLRPQSSEADSLALVPAARKETSPTVVPIVLSFLPDTQARVVSERDPEDEIEELPLSDPLQLATVVDPSTQSPFIAFLKDDQDEVGSQEDASNPLLLAPLFSAEQTGSNLVFCFSPFNPLVLPPSLDSKAVEVECDFHEPLVPSSRVEILESSDDEEGADELEMPAVPPPSPKTPIDQETHVQAPSIIPLVLSSVGTNFEVQGEKRHVGEAPLFAPSIQREEDLQRPSRRQQVEFASRRTTPYDTPVRSSATTRGSSDMQREAPKPTRTVVSRQPVRGLNAINQEIIRKNEEASARSKPKSGLAGIVDGIIERRNKKYHF